MNRKSLILAILLVLLVFISASAVSAADDANTISAGETSNAQEVTVATTDTNDQIQEKINALNDGDILNFEKGDYKNISLYVNKSITINGNGANLYGYDTLSKDHINPIIYTKTTNGGYAITNLATLYILETKGLVLKDINLIAGANSGTDKGADARYSNCVLYNHYSNNTKIINTTINGCSWGIWLQNCNDVLIENNNVRNQGITGIFSFQSKRTKIINNTVTNAKNHGIDVRHKVGPNAQIINNTVIGAKEGIYLLHSSGHTVTGNKIINCSLSSITCCGSTNITIKDNSFYNSRIGVLLGGSAPVGGSYAAYENITIGANEWKFDELPFPPSFKFYVAEAKGDYASLDAMMGTHTDSSLSDVTYVEYTGIETPSKVVVDYDTLLKPTGTNYAVTSGMTNDEIQTIINGMANGDSLIFEKDAVFENISLYIVNKNIKIIGNNATLISRDSAKKELIPGIIINGTAAGGFGISYSAVIYSVNNTGTVISDLNINCKYPAYDASSINQYSEEYCTAGIYAYISKNIAVTGCTIKGASWGMFIGEKQNGCPNAILTNNKISNQYTTGILCFGSAKSIIANNTVTNAKNHGIDVRFGMGSSVTVFNNTISGAKEGIYLLHSQNHKVYNNTILNSKISSITCYGSGNEYIFNNTLKGSRIAILLGGGYYNVTIGPNTFTPDKLPFPPTFEYFLVKSEDKYQSASKVMRSYWDKEVVSLTANNKNTYVKTITSGYKYPITLKDSQGNALANKTIIVTFNGKTYKATTNDKGVAVVTLKATTPGTKTATITFEGDYEYQAVTKTATIKVTKEASKLSTPKKTFKASVKTKKYTVTLKSNSGKAIAKAKVTIKINGKTFSATTNSKGQATFKMTKLTKRGTFTSTVKFAGDKYYNSVTQKVKITIKR